MHESGWASPEQAPPADPAAPTATIAPPLEAGRRLRAGPVPTRRPPELAVFARPLTLADLLDGAFGVIKARPRAVIGMAALFVLPFGLLIAVVDLGALGGDSLGVLFDPATYEAPEPGAEQQDVGGDLAGTIVGALAQSALVTAIAAPLARMVEAWYLRREMTPIEAIRAVGVGWLSIAAAFVVVHAVQVVGTLLVVPGLAAMVLFSVTAPVISVERLGPLAGMRRSARLVRRRFFPVLWICLATALVSSLLTALVPLLPVAAVELVGAPGRDIVVAIATIAVSLVALPFVAATAVLTHLDLRVRTEGLDLRLALDECFG